MDLGSESRGARTMICTTTTLKAPVPDTLAFVDYHLRVGIDRMYLFFDDPDDRAIDRLRNVQQVTCTACDEKHWERLQVDPSATITTKMEANATRALHRARVAGAHWLIHLDSDEVLFCEESVHELLDGVPASADVVLFPPMEAVPQRLFYERPFEEITLFKPYPAVDHPPQFSVRDDNLRPISFLGHWSRSTGGFCTSTAAVSNDGRPSGAHGSMVPRTSKPNGFPPTARSSCSCSVRAVLPIPASWRSCTGDSTFSRRINAWV